MQWPNHVKTTAEWCAAIVELVGVVLIAGLALYAVAFAVVQILRRIDGDKVFQETRALLVRGVLLGLEFLVAADIIHTVAVDLTWTSVGVLAIIVAIRTFLSFALELELAGRWPWQEKKN